MHDASDQASPSRLVEQKTVPALFDKWIGERIPVFLGTNYLSQELPFSNWYRFKEAFSPEIVKQAITEHPVSVETCLDPFSGSGTTALTAQFMGISSVSFEVNPFLADLGRAKVETYDVKEIHAAFDEIMAVAEKLGSASDVFSETWLPETFVEPGKNGKWLFNVDVAHRVLTLRKAISSLPNPAQRRLFRVILGSSLIENSNVTINGKGRRYRNKWQYRSKTGSDLMRTFQMRAAQCFVDIEKFSLKSATVANIELQDIRDQNLCFPKFDVSVFSPPYPNSFDYTDVYNVELWMMGYLKSRENNIELRKKTITSHLQVTRPFSVLAEKPASLMQALFELEKRREHLWDKRITGMLETYFFEMSNLLRRLLTSKKPKGRVWIIVGNSQYAGVEIETGQILAEIAEDMGFSIVMNEVSRKLRTSPQQGGAPKLGESILVLG
ncbi:hypothetical protein [Rhodobacter lacus]|uniref:Methyltransferase n=1 Tax=Rhodobacter lacus TaxID=1641972 RepID=A0ABW5A9J3_9RHOB